MSMIFTRECYLQPTRHQGLVDTHRLAINAEAFDRCVKGADPIVYAFCIDLCCGHMKSVS